MGGVLLRPLLPDDAPAAAATAVAALPEAPDLPGGRDAWTEARIAHLQRTDPGGAWVAEDEDGVAGVALALVRDGIWGLSLMAVRPALHGHGLGGRLLRAVLAHGDGGRGALIASSADPRAMRIYAGAGFALRPCVALAGMLDRAALPAGLRSAPSDDVEQAAALAAPVRGGAYDPADLELLRDGPNRELLLMDGRGFAVHASGGPMVLAAADEAAATDLLWSCLGAGPPGGTLHVEFLTAGQDWAVRAGLAAGLALSPEGPLFTRGALGPLRPWLPSGTLL